MYANLVVSPVGHHRITVLSREMLRDVTNRDATKTAENEERKIYKKTKSVRMKILPLKCRSQLQHDAKGYRKKHDDLVYDLSDLSSAFYLFYFFGLVCLEISYLYVSPRAN